MSAVEALRVARAAGVDLRVDGDALTLDADAAPPPAVLELLSRHKPGVIALLLQNDEPRGPQVGVQDWLERLLARPRPDSEPLARWQAHCTGVRQFVEDGWHRKAVALGWTHDGLFTLRDPFANLSLQGAAWFVGDKTITAVTADAITLRSAGGSTTRIYRSSDEEVGP